MRLGDSVEVLAVCALTPDGELWWWVDGYHVVSLADTAVRVEVSRGPWAGGRTELPRERVRVVGTSG